MERAVRSAMSSRPSSGISSIPSIVSLRSTSCSLDKNDDVERKVGKCIDRSTMVTPCKTKRVYNMMHNDIMMFSIALAETQLEDKGNNNHLGIVSIFTECIEEDMRRVLDKFSIDIVEAGLDPIVFAERLHSRGLISKIRKIDAQTIGLPDSTKTFNILHGVSGYLRTTRKPKDVLKAFCHVLVQEPSTRPIVSKIEHYLGTIS